MVRLKDFSISFLAFAAEFQFQYGAIKGISNAATSFENTLFQFQYGAIKGHQDFHLWQFSVLSFNSNMVRLKAYYYVFQ